MPLTLADRAATKAPLPLTTTAESRLLGIRLDPRRWLRIRRGVHVERAAFVKLAPWQRYQLRVHAFLRTAPDAVLCLESAAVVHGLPLFNETLHIHVLAGPGEKPRRFGDVWVHTSEFPRAVEQIDGLYVTSLLDTAVDLSRVLPAAKSLTLVDSAISLAQGGSVDILAALDRLDAQSNRRGAARARWTWSHANALAESPSESVSRAVIEWSGFETPELQRRFRYEGVEDRVDFHFPSCRAIGESDEWQKYTLSKPEEAVRLLTDEKLREDRLRRNGHPFARWDLRDARRVDPLCHALRSAGVPLTRLPQPAMLASLRQNAREVPPAREIRKTS